MGLAGALLLAKEIGIVASLHDLLDELERQANFYLETRVRESLLHRAKEM
jgi:predicted nucleic acid-binding protein